MQIRFTYKQVRLESGHDLVRMAFAAHCVRNHSGLNLSLGPLSSTGYSNEIGFYHHELRRDQVRAIIASSRETFEDSFERKYCGFTEYDLVDRGWTKSAIKVYLGYPDRKLVNRKDASFLDAIYDIERVLTVESSYRWRYWLEGSVMRKAHLNLLALKAIGSLGEQVRVVQEMDLFIEKLSVYDLRRYSVSNHLVRCEPYEAEFNYLTRCYKAHLVELAKIDFKLRDIFRNRIHAKIYAMYPHFLS